MALVSTFEQLQQRASIDLSAALACQACGLMLQYIKQNFEPIDEETEVKLLNAFAKATAGRFSKSFEAGVEAVVKELHKGKKDNAYRRFSKVDLT
jgi:hypothetical protein